MWRALLASYLQVPYAFQERCGLAPASAWQHIALFCWWSTTLCAAGQHHTGLAGAFGLSVFLSKVKICAMEEPQGRFVHVACRSNPCPCDVDSIQSWCGYNLVASTHCALIGKKNMQEPFGLLAAVATWSFKLYREWFLCSYGWSIRLLSQSLLAIVSQSLLAIVSQSLVPIVGKHFVLWVNFFFWQGTKKRYFSQIEKLDIAWVSKMKLAEWFFCFRIVIHTYEKTIHFTPS